MLWFLVILIIVTIVLDLPALIKNKDYKEIIVFSVILFAGIYLGLVHIYKLPFYNALSEWASILESR